MRPTSCYAWILSGLVCLAAARFDRLSAEASPPGQDPKSTEAPESTLATARAQAALDEKPGPTGLPVQLSVLTFPETSGAPRVSLLVASPIASADTGQGPVDGDYTILARVLDVSGAVVWTETEPFHAGAPRDGAPGASARVLFSRQPRLAPGHYKIEAAIAEVAGARAGVARTNLDVPAPAASGLDVSSLVVVESAEAADPAADPANPLISGGRLLHPSLTGEAAPGSNGSIGVFFRIAGARSTPTGRLRLLRDGAPLSEVTLTLPAPDASGRIAYQARLPTGSLVPGLYDLRLVLHDGVAPIERKATFRKTR